MHKNAFAAGSLPRTPLQGKLTPISVATGGGQKGATAPNRPMDTILRFAQIH